jgi:hypothetical protein
MMPIREIVATTLGQLIDEITPAAADPRTGRRRDSGIYRGAIDACRPLLSSLDRLGGVDPPHTKTALEEHILRNFIRYSRPYFSSVPDEWELLVIAQHHGLPTRLLDWSYSPVVAAHFATLEDSASTDRVVWRLDWKKMHKAFGLPELALSIEDLGHSILKGRKFTPWDLVGQNSEVPTFACMFEPPSIDKRLIVQSAVFTFCSDTSQSFDSFLDRHELAGALTKFIIPAGEARGFRDQLDLLSIDERRLFLDLDGLAAQLRRYYS